MSFHSGWFELSSGERVIGELTLDGRKSKMTLRSSADFPPSEEASSTIRGRGSDGKFITCLNCVPNGQSSAFSPDGSSFHSLSFFPHYVIVGDQPLGLDEEVVTSVTFATQDLAVICCDRRAAGSTYPSAEVAAQLSGSAVEDVSPNAVAAYFNGRSEILEAHTVLGNVRLLNGVSASPGDVQGVSIKYNFQVKVEFDAPQSLSDAERAVFKLKRLLGVVAGRRQLANSFQISHRGLGDDHLTSTVSVCMESSSPEDEAQLHEWDLPLNPTRGGDEFRDVLARWLDRDEARLTARVSFSECLAKGRRYSVDRLVAAANMFDLLPASDVPTAVPLSPELEKAVQDARVLMRSVDPSPPRDSVLSALGRVGKPSLASKVLHRAAIITSLVPGHFPGIEKLLIFAVKCRNHCVHGSPVGIEPKLLYPSLPFLTDALEFVFIASELIECGWDIERWSRAHGGWNHPLRAFLATYHDGRKVLLGQGAFGH